MAKPKVVPVASVVATSEDLLEIIRTDGGSPALVRCKGGELSIARKFTIESTTYVPAEIPAEMRLPSGASNPASLQMLVQETTDLVCALTGVGASTAELSAFLVAATFFTDLLNPTLRVAVTCGDGTHALRFLEVLSHLTRHALPVAAFSYDLVSWLPIGCAPTILVSHPMLSSEMVRLMIATQHASFAVPRHGQIIARPYSAVILDDALKIALPDSFIRIDATPEVRPSRLDVAALRKLRDKQAEFLGHRVRNWARVSKNHVDASALAGSTATVAAAIASVFPDTPDLQNRVLELFKPQDELCRVAASCGPRAVTLDALMVLCHQGHSAVHVGKIAETANAILEERGDGYSLNAREVGSHLSYFSLRADPSDRDAKGYRVPLSSAVRRRIHELARLHDAPFLKGDITPCAFCLATSPVQK
jgi:hypothetical protein